MKRQIKRAMYALAATFMLSFTLAGHAQTTPTTASEKTQWEKEHPRRDEVNDRLEHQNQRIQNEVKSGEISHAEAKKLHAEDHQIRQEEHAMAASNGGHITKTEQKALNQQENQVSKQIGH